MLVRGSSSGHPFAKVLPQGSKQLKSIRAAENLLSASFGMGHHAEHIPFAVADTGDTVKRPIGIGIIS
jgi:hypothetical protein